MSRGPGRVLLGAGLLVSAAARAVDPASPLEGLPPARPLYSLTQPAPEPAVRTPEPQKRSFGLALAELAILQIVPWFHNRYLNGQEYAQISWQTVSDNINHGLSFEDDHDKFSTNQVGHPIHGGLYYNAGRSNGFGFWGSTAFAAAGAYTWQMWAEANSHSLNDFVTTTMGGPTLGEPLHRLTKMILDNEARGVERVLRETAVFFTNPPEAFTRIVTGDMWNVHENPSDRMPPKFVFLTDAGYRHIGRRARPEVDQLLIAPAIRYGDPFLESASSKPFDYFELSAEISTPSSAWLSRAAARGLVADWSLGSPGSATHKLGVLLDFSYLNNEPRVFGMQSVRGGLLSSYRLGRETALRTEILGFVAPLASLNPGHSESNLELYGRGYDWGPGGGVYATAYVRRRDVDLFVASYQAFWMHTSAGIGRNSVVQEVRAEARIPLFHHASLGGGWNYTRRLSTFDEFSTISIDGTSWRLFGELIFR